MEGKEEEGKQVNDRGKDKIEGRCEGWEELSKSRKNGVCGGG